MSLINNKYMNKKTNYIIIFSLLVVLTIGIIFTDYVKQLGTILADASAPNPGHSLSEIEGWETLVKTSGDQTIAGVKNFSGNVGIGTATPGAKLDIVAPANSGAGNELRICKNGTCCPIWKDCDGDGRTYGNGDCDESCPTCYVGSSANTTVSDGKDQNCDGAVDEYIARTAYVCGEGEHDYCMPKDEATCLNKCISIYGPLATATLGPWHEKCYPATGDGSGGIWFDDYNSIFGDTICYGYCDCNYKEYH